MKSTVVLIGIGEIGGIFAHGLLRLGYPIYPVTRASRPLEAALAVPEPELVLVATGESDLQPVLQDLPEVWRDRVALLQNELLPRDWQRHHISTPTVISVWFEKKPGKAPKVIIPSVIYGPHADLLAAALDKLHIPTRILADQAELLHQLVLKNVYILTTNIAGLVTAGTVSSLWLQHQSLARAVANEIIELQQRLTGVRFNHDALINGMIEAFEGDPEHQCTGRSAPARLQRALLQAEQLGLSTPKLKEIAAQSQGTT